MDKSSRSYAACTQPLRLLLCVRSFSLSHVGSTCNPSAQISESQLDRLVAMKHTVDKKALTASFSAPCCELRLVHVTA